MPAATPRRPGLIARFLRSRFVAVIVVLIAIVVIWYAGAYFLDAPFQHDLDQRAGVTPVADRFHRRRLQPAEADAAGAAPGGDRPL